MSFYFIGQPDPEDPHRWTYNTGVHSTMAIVEALKQAGFTALTLKNSESIAPYLDELDISKAGATREDVERICAAADPELKPSRPPPGTPARRFSL